MDQELLPALPVPKVDFADVAAERAKRATALAAAPPLPAEIAGALEITDVLVPGEPPVRVRLYRPSRTDGTAWPAVVWLHGGGFVVGSVEADDVWSAQLAQRTGALVVSVEYRLAPEHPYPAAIEDAYLVLSWLAAEATALVADPARIVLAGSSAGAGLAAGLALLTRDRGGPVPCFQLLNHPELDDRLRTPSMRSGADTPGIDRAAVELSWRHYLGAAGGEPPAYAVPARATDLGGLPPAYIATSEHDPLRDEGIHYALALLAAGVPVELHQYPGTFHGSQRVRTAAVSRRQTGELADALRRAISH